MAKEKDELIKQMENDKKDLTTKLEANIQETNTVKQTLKRKHQQLNMCIYMCACVILGHMAVD